MVSTVEIPLSNGGSAVVDEADVDKVSAYRWLNSGGYVRTNVKIGGRRTQISMHRLLMCPADPTILVDHANGNGLDNTRSNLRLCTHSENMRNRSRHGDKYTSVYKGVYFEKGERKWRAEIRKNGKRTKLGRFNSEGEAAEAYDTAALRMHGSFARTNADLGLLKAA